MSWFPGHLASPFALVLAAAMLWLWRPQRSVTAALRIFALFALCGALRGAVVPQSTASISGVSCAALADDRAHDEVVGLIRGPIEDGPGSRRFVVQGAGQVRVLVTVRGEPMLPVLPGDRVLVRGRLRSPRGYRVPGGVDWRKWLRSHGADLMLSARSTHVEVITKSARFSAWRMPTRVQRTAAARIAQRSAAASAKAVVRAMTLGDRGGLDPHTVASFRGAGVSHVLAVSGLHLAVVVMLLLFVSRWLWAAVPGLWLCVSPHRAAAVIAAAGSVLFALVTGGRVSTLRALVVALIVLFAIATGRRVRVLDALGTAAVVLLAISPTSLFDPSFQLSFAATLTLVLAFGGTRKAVSSSRWQRLRRYPFVLAHASAWASLATAPFAAMSFHSFAPAGFIANVFIVPLAELIVLPVGLLGVLVQTFWHDAGGLLIDLSLLVAALVIKLANAFSSWLPPWQVPAPRWWELFALALVWAAALCWRRRVVATSRCALMAAFGVLVVLSSWAITAHVLPSGRTHLRIVFLDVGQGDAAVIEMPGGATWLVDAGGRPFVVPRPGESKADQLQRAAAPGRMSVLRYLQHRRVRRLELVILSHPHPDHYMGLFAVANVVPIDEVWVAKPPPGDAGGAGGGTYRQLIELLRQRGTRIVHPDVGLARTTHGVQVSVLHPAFAPGVATADPSLEANDNSLTVAIEFGQRRVLFAGDVEVDAEHELLANRRAALRADVIKVPHHGSDTSSTAGFVDAVGASYAIISCGLANRFGFPSPRVVSRWLRRGAAVLRTDRVGAITVDIFTNGTLDVSTYDRWQECASSD